MRVTCIVDESISAKIDTEYVRNIFKDLGNIALIFVCTLENWRTDRKWTDKKEGTKYYRIRLPYEEVLHTDDARPLMVKAVKERLGLTETNPPTLPIPNNGTEAVALGAI